MKSPLRYLLLAVSVSLFLSACGPRYVGPEPLVEDLFSEAKTLYEKGKFGEAKEKFEGIKFDYPGNSYIGEVQFYLGLCAFALKDYPAAEQDFRTVVREFPATESYAPSAHYHLCLTLFRQSQPARLDQALTYKTIEETESFLDAYPKDAYADSVKQLQEACTDRLAEKEFLAGRLYRRMGYTSSAIHYFKALETAYPGSRWCVRGRYEWALSYYLQKNYTDAARIADTCGMMLETLAERDADAINRNKVRGGVYHFFHLYGLIPYDLRSDLKVYVDDLRRDLARLNRKIQKKKAK